MFNLVGRRTTVAVVAYPYIDLGNLPNRAMLYRYILLNTLDLVGENF